VVDSLAVAFASSIAALMGSVLGLQVVVLVLDLITRAVEQDD